ncbi:MAG: SDR family NAD(P)-dependent oxidoreductase [Pirellulaceae bacterium]
MPRWYPENATTIVTGASSGIGMQIAKQLVAQGAVVIAVARREERLQELVRSATISPSNTERIIPVAGDITDPGFRERIIACAANVSDRLDLLVNNAGVGGIGPFREATPERLRRIMEVNFFASVELTRLALPMLRKGKSPVICNVSSVLGHFAVPDKSEYCASKFALHGWSDAMRAELAEEGIQVTLISPSTTSSEFFDVAIETQASAVQKRRQAMPPERVAALALRAITRRRDEAILSAGGKFMVYADRLCPWLVNRLVRRHRSGRT